MHSWLGDDVLAPVHWTQVYTVILQPNFPVFPATSWTQSLCLIIVHPAGKWFVSQSPFCRLLVSLIEFKCRLRKKLEDQSVRVRERGTVPWVSGEGDRRGRHRKAQSKESRSKMLTLRRAGWAAGKGKQQPSRPSTLAVSWRRHILGCCAPWAWKQCLALWDQSRAEVFNLDVTWLEFIVDQELLCVARAIQEVLQIGINYIYCHRLPFNLLALGQEGTVRRILCSQFTP